MKRTIIYVEWLDSNGEFENGFFYSYDEYIKFFFSPSLTITKVQICK